MPKRLTTPDSKLTYGKVVNYVLDDRDARMESLRLQKFQQGTSRFYNNLLDVLVFISCHLIMMAYVKYVVDCAI